MDDPEEDWENIMWSDIELKIVLQIQINSLKILQRDFLDFLSFSFCLS